MYGGNIDTRILQSVFLDLSNNWCCLRDIVRTTNLQREGGGGGRLSHQLLNQLVILQSMKGGEAQALTVPPPPPPQLAVMTQTARGKGLIKAHLDVPPADNNSVHLLQCELSRFCRLILHKSIPLVFHRSTIP